MNIKIWLFIVIVLAVLVIGFVVGRQMKKNAECADCNGKKDVGAVVAAATGVSTTAAASTTKQGMNVEASQKG